MSIQAEIDKLHAQIAELEKRKEALQILKTQPARFIADMMHSLQCHHNHDDQCSWFYETWDKAGHDQRSTKGRYLVKAENFLVRVKEYTPSDLDILRIIEDFVASFR